MALLAREAMELMNRSVAGLLRGEEPDFESMATAQMYSGLTMQMMGSSRAASGAEHLIAHLVEMKPPRFESAHGIHGECVGVGSVLAAEEYHRLASLGRPRARAFEPLDEGWVREKFGPLADGILAENAHDVLSTFDPQRIVDVWDEIVYIISQIPSAEELAGTFRDLEGKYRLSDIGIDESLKPEILDISSAIRNRLTLARMRRVLDFGE